MVPANLKGQPGIFLSAAEWKDRGYIMNDEARAKNLPGWREVLDRDEAALRDRLQASISGAARSAINRQ